MPSYTDCIVIVRHRGEEIRYCVLTIVAFTAIVTGCSSASARGRYPLPRPRFSLPGFSHELESRTANGVRLLTTPEGVKGYRDGELVLEKSLHEALCDSNLCYSALSLLDDLKSPPSPEILGKVKELAIQRMKTSEDDAIVNAPVYKDSPVMVLRSWDSYKPWQRLREQGYPIRGQRTNGLVLWLIEVWPSATGIRCTVRVDNLTDHDLHLYPKITTWDLLIYEGPKSRKISTAQLRPTYREEKYHVIKSKQGMRDSCYFSLQGMKSTEPRAVLLQVVLRSRNNGVSDPNTWAGGVRNPKFQVTLPPHYENANEDLEYWRAHLTTRLEKGSFPEASRFSWSVSYGFDFTTAENNITGEGIWLAMPDDLRRLSQKEVRTICSFLLEDDVFAKGFETSSEYLGKYPPREAFFLRTDRKRGSWYGHWLKRDASERWKQILARLLNRRLKIARERIVVPGEKQKKTGAEPGAPADADNPRR